MFPLNQICDRLKITPPRLKDLIELIEDAGYKCSPLYADSTTYYSIEVVGWVMQLKRQIESGLAQDFKAIAVDKAEVNLMMKKPVAADIVEVASEPVKNHKRDLSPEAIALAVAKQLATAYYSPYAQKAEEMRYKQELQGLLKEAIARGDMLSRDDINNFVDRYPPKSTKVNCHWDYGIYRFTYLGLGLWTADYKKWS